MSDRRSVFPEPLQLGQIKLIARRYGIFSGKSMLDVGCTDQTHFDQLASRGAQICGLTDQEPTDHDPSVQADERLHVGSAAASIPFAAHSLDLVLLRGTELFESDSDSPEMTIALANLLSCLKPKAHLVVPVLGGDDPSIEQWKSRLEPFQVRARVRTVSQGLIALVTFAWLFGKTKRMTLLEFSVDRTPISRLEWHRLAREAVMKRIQTPPAAA